MHFIIIFILCISICICSVPNQRPPKEQRTFSSHVIDSLILNITQKMRDKDLAQIFENALPNTLDTTIKFFNKNELDTFIVTGGLFSFLKKKLIS